MIVQQINLYQERFREKNLWISATQVAATLLIVLAAGLIWSLVLSFELGQTEQRNLALKADRDSVAVEVAVVNSELAELLEDKRLDQKIEGTARQISARKRVLKFVEANRFGSGEGFADYLVALSNLQVDNIWLNRIRLSENFVQLKGSALSATEVPSYFDSFGEEQIFQGNRFDLFQLSRAKDSDWKVDFEIATSGDFNE